jgi:RNA polymerase subunit RPABC4/transcription elongation factor Spt4
MQEKTCPRCGLAVRAGQLACDFCGASLVTGKSRRFMVIALTTMLALLIALFAAQWFALHHASRAPVPESGAVSR